jgi:Domain of unknown function (DUF4253)
VSPVPVPSDESVTINGAWLGPGRQVHGDGPGPAVAWASERVVHQPGLHWRLIAEESAVTSLQPILLSGLDGSAERPWDSGEFDAPGDAADIDRCDAASLLTEGWGAHEPSADEIAADGAQWWADYNSMFEPYGGEFPGLAPAIDNDINPLRLEVAVGQYLPPARIGLVPAARPADVLTALGWLGVTNRGWQPAQVSAVLRSWEDRYGARLLEVGFAEFRLVVSRPPRTVDEALPIAAEHIAFCDECGRMGLRHVRMLAKTLVDNPFWDFWWD